MHAGVGHILAPEELPQRSACAPEDYAVVGDAVKVKYLEDGRFVRTPVNDIAHCFSILLDVCSYWSDAQVLANHFPSSVVNEFCEIHLAHHRRHHVGVLQVEVVVGAVEVGRHHGYVVGAVLEVVTFAHFQAGNLCNRVFLVGVLQRGGQKAVFLHRLRGVLRVDAGGAEEEEFLHSVGVGLADDVALNFHIHHYEVRPVEAVGHYSADERGCEHYGIRSFFIEELLHRILVCEIQFLVVAAYEIIVAPAFEIVPDGGAYEAVVAGYVDFAFFA